MPQSADQNIRYTIEDKLFIIQIHRPEKKNALLPSMYKALADGIKLADARPDSHLRLDVRTDVVVVE